MIRKPLRQRRLAVMLAALSLAGAAYAQANFSSLEERMSYKEFKDYGLDKLTPEQLRGLNEWLHAHGASGVAGVGAARSLAPTASASAASVSIAFICNLLLVAFTGGYADCSCGVSRSGIDAITNA